MCKCVYMHASVCACLITDKHATLNLFSVASTQHFTADHFGLDDHWSGGFGGGIFLTLGSFWFSIALHLGVGLQVMPPIHTGLPTGVAIEFRSSSGKQIQMVSWRWPQFGPEDCTSCQKPSVLFWTHLGILFLSVSFHMPHLSSIPLHVTFLFPREEHLVSTYCVPWFCCPRKIRSNNHNVWLW